MSDIFASLAAGTARPAAGQGVAETVVRVVDPSPDLTRLASGESLRGTVVGRDDHGHLQVRTRLGVLTLTLPRALPVGTEVVLQVRSIGPQVMLNLLPLDTPTLATPAPPASGVTPPGPAVAVTHPLAAGDIVERGQLLRAILHAPPPLPSLAGLPTAQPGTELLVRILALGTHAPGTGIAAALVPAAPPAAAAAPAAPGSAPGLAPGAAPAQPGLSGSLGPAPAGAGVGAVPAVATPATGGGAVPALPGAPAGPAGAPAAPSLPVAAEPSPGLRLAPQAPVGASGHSLATALQGAGSLAAAKAAGVPAMAAANPDAANPATAPAPGTAAAATVKVTGLVTAATSGGQPILHTPLGTVTLDTRAALPPGTSLALEVALPAATLGPGGPWPSQESLEQALFQGLTAGQAEAIARTLPQVGPRLASGILFFLSALNQGNLADWLSRAGGGGGPAERAELPAGLAERLGREIAALARSIETPSGEWRFVNLPLWSDQGLRELRCYFRHQQHGGKGGGEGDKATRFVLELELTRHGTLQLDGLVRGRLFDLVLRSRRAMPALVRGDLMALFEEANAIAGYNGRLVFQASQDWLQLAAARSAAQPHDGLKV